MPAIRRKERSGPGMAYCDDAVMGPASGVEVAVEESATAELAESPALADKQPREKSETITKTERQEGHFMAGSPLKSEGPHATRSTSRRAGVPRTELRIIPGPGISGLRFQCRPKYAIFPDYPRNFVFLPRFSFYGNENGGNGRSNTG